jgi:antitoxin (DNA-binding transcriptional repressor) of toxin-antitoxin stability system
MMSVSASKFKEQCLAILDNLDPEGIVITKHDKPVARVVPEGSHCADLIGSMKGKIRIIGTKATQPMRSSPQQHCPQDPPFDP